MDGRSPSSSDHFGLLSPFPSSSIAMSPQYGHSCALTILKGDADHPITAHEPIHKKHESSRGPLSPSQPSRFAASFSNLRSASHAASSGFDSSVHVHAVSDHGILLPFLERPAEVKELLFETKANETLMHRLCSVFGGDADHPLLRGKDERWDEMLELLIELDRPLLDDEDWLARLESLVMERSPSLWAQLARCLGADGLPNRPTAQPRSSRFDSWALPSRYMDASHDDNDSPLPTPSAVSSEDDHDAHIEHSLFVNVEPLAALPQSYSEQPAGKMQQSTLHEEASPAVPSSQLQPLPAERHVHQTSPGELFAMSADRQDANTTTSLHDIMEESHPSSLVGENVRSRARSHSGKFAGLRISALSSSSPPASRRASDASVFHRDVSSPLPTGVMSPAGLAPHSPGVSASQHTSTSFSKHRRLSVMMMHNQPTQQHQSYAHDHDNLKDLDSALSPTSTSPRRRRGVSEAQHRLPSPALHPHTRRRARSFARSFAELTSPTQHVEQLRADHAKAEADRLADSTRRISLQDTHEPSTASAPAAPTGALGLHASPDPLESASASVAGDKIRRASRPRNHILSVDRMSAASDAGSDSPPIPGLLPDGRTRHPSGSCGSRDLSESIAAFRANMGLSISPSPSVPGSPKADDAKSDADKSTDSTTRKRKGTSPTDLPAPTSRTADTVEPKISRRSSPDQAQFSKPKHMEDVEARVQTTAGSGLALGGGFSLAKSGANFRRQSHDAATIPQGGWRASFARRDGGRGRGGEPYSLRSPPAVQRRPGGFVSLAQEYERARQGRRSSEVGYSMHSVAVASSSASSLPDVGEDRRRGEEEEASEKDATSPDVVRGEPTPIAVPGGGVTPRASFAGSRLTGRQPGYPFPAVTRTHDDAPTTRTLAPATPLSPLHACPSSNTSAHPSPRSPSIVFPISPNPSISRARELSKALTSPRCTHAFSRITHLCGRTTSESIRELLINTERSSMHDEQLLEEVARRLGLVDHEQAHKVGGTEAEEADVRLAEEGYEERWEAFCELCGGLGVGNVELGAARRRCGPAIDTCS
ncbi:hypothetical protein PSEUBRA_002347 [Kalmanozyma brasiliensis GHG001]|uniref:uncharacterized protein n=1 Tax=Kalmanozyma brasiliensis (strain GHG001) TaxID=1365824 RepID=UPI001CE97132|nr:uncharacterized protein PSEUBRA_002347 [Kalmanozyma brasiliensis GHG001]EST07963.2 hypothetical protein PSEUBRA_002347 [Kalmanozyma brasiliensis GHG001]